MTRMGRRMSVGVAVATLFAVVLAVGVAGSFSRECSICHTEASEALEVSSHASASCYDCHLTRGAWGFAERKAEEFLVMYPQQLLGFERPILTQTSRKSCLGCHDDILSEVTSSRGLRIAHFTCAQNSSCDDCHATVAHGVNAGRLSYPSMSDCVSCHAERNVTLECKTCHDGDREQRATGAWQVTHGVNWRVTHGMGDSETCAVCHGSEFCVKCHEIGLPHPDSFGTTHGTDSLDHPASCVMCHERASFCDPCHGVQMPHAEGFVKVHSTEAVTLGEEKCAHCHTMDDCVDCHANHVHPGGSSPPPPAVGLNR